VPERILIIDDERSVHDVARAYLEREGYEVLSAIGGRDGLALAQALQPSLVVLDLMLPDLGGDEVCETLRRDSDIAIVMLTAKSTEDDRIRGLDIGADDYLVKPFSPRELVLRVQSVLRRSGVVASGPALPRRLVAGDVVVDVPGRSVTVAGRAVTLTAREFDLLVHLMAHPGRAFTRTQLMNDVWGWEFGDTSTVTVHVRRLREKLEPDPSRPRRLVADWGVGYRWEETA